MNTTPSPSYKYKVGGSLEKDAPSYVVRQADEDFYTALRSAEFCYVLNSRQMGKSSLRVQTMQRLQTDGVACGVIDITSIGSHAITPAEWYLGIVRRLAKAFGTSVKTLNWWSDREGISPVQRLGEFIEDVLLVEVTQPIVVFIDEIDSVLRLEFKDDFFALIRACYNQRAEKADYQRLTFALLGVATPSDLIQDKNRTPFNIGRAIELQGFQLAEAQPLVPGLERKVDQSEAVMRAVLDWTGGQPFLTQKLCQLIVESPFQIAAGSEAELVEQLVRSRILTNWEAQDEPQHLRTIRDRLLSNEQRLGRLLGLYQQILQQEGIAADDSSDQMELRLTGLVVKREGRLYSYNRIHAEVFSQRWLNKVFNELRPYAEELNTWVASNYQDESQLLQGKTLQEARAWAEGKSLSDKDYHFLDASQEVDKKAALVVEQKAREELLEVFAKLVVSVDASRSSLTKLPASIVQAQQRLKRQSRRIGAFIGLVVAGLVIGTRQLGGFQPLELKIYDLFLQSRPEEQVDSRVVVIGISNGDIQKLQQAPITDKTLAKLLTILESYNPRAIGIDILRDIPQGPLEGRKSLAKVIAGSNRIISACSLSSSFSPGSSPAPGTPEGSVGFADLPIDSDGVTRRISLVSVPGKFDSTPRHPCNDAKPDNEIPSLSFLLALTYLEAEGINAEPGPNRTIQLRKTLLRRLGRTPAGYSDEERPDYQMLLNYRDIGNVIQSISIVDVLQRKINPDLIKNQVILVGYVTDNDNIKVSSFAAGRELKSIPGVFVHAHSTSAIISAVLDSRTLISYWSDWSEYLWILVWITIGTITTFKYQRIAHLVFMTTLLIILLLSICYMFLSLGVWLPSATPLLGLTMTMASITGQRKISEYRLQAAIHLLRIIRIE